MCNNWTEDQKNIYAGLKNFGGEAAGYFKSAMTYYYDAILPNRVSHLAHDAREIDGGLRDIFSPESLKKKTELNLLSRGMEKLFGSELKAHKGHIASILVALDVDEKDELAREWFRVATKFAKYAHRSGVGKNERPFDEFEPLWKQYEAVLLKLVGSYYAMTSRIDRLIALEEINYDSIEALLNLLKNKPYSDYFFGKVRGLSWFDHLKENNIFNPANIPRDNASQYLFWDVLRYIEHVSTLIVQHPQKGQDLLNIIHGIVQYSCNTSRINNYHIWWYCVKILNNLPHDIIKEHLSVEKFHLWLSVWTGHSFDTTLVIDDIGKILLPKFLGDDSTIEYAEAIVDVITKVKTGVGTHAFIRQEGAVLVGDSYWVQEAFKRNHLLIGKKCSLDVIFGLANRLKDVLEYKKKEHYVNVEIGNDVYKIKVSRVFADRTQTDEINFIPGQYECVVMQYSPEQLKGVDWKNEFWALHNIEPQIELKRFPITAFGRSDMVSIIKSNLPSGINWTNAEKYEKKLSDMFGSIHSDYAHIWYKSLAQGSEHPFGVEQVLASILRDVLLAKCDAKRPEGRHVLDEFLSEKYQFPIFKRFVLLCADKFWADYAELLDKFIDLNPAALKSYDFEVELHDVLRNHNFDFGTALKTKLKVLIGNVPEYYVQKGEKLAAYWRYKWLSPLRDNPDFSDLYEEAKRMAEPKDGKPYEPERLATEVVDVVHKAPVTKEDILQKPVLELAKYLNEFKGAEFWSGTFEGEPDKDGLADALQAAVRENPKKFTDGIDAFHVVGYFYLHRLPRGFKEAWSTGKEIDWGKIFDFSLKYFKQDKVVILGDALRAQGEDSGDGRYVWMIEDIVDLIADGCKDDKRAFGPEYFDKVEQIFDLVLPLLKGEKRPDTERDALGYALNTTLGRTIIAYVSFSLRAARATQKKQENWGSRKYERFFAIGVDAYIWFGHDLPQISYLDEKYAKEKIGLFAKKPADDFEWQMFMEGYLFGPGVYPNIYYSMRGNYEKALENNVFEGRTDQRLVEHIALGYLHYGEMLEGNNKNGEPSLFSKILAGASVLGKRERWLKTAEFFWTRTGREIKKESKEDEDASERIKDRILEFWAWTYTRQEFVKANLGDNYDAFLGQMAELTTLLDKIDDEKEKWLLLCAPHIERHHNSAFFMESLSKFDDEESIRRIGKIFLKVLEHTIPTFREDNIKLIVRRIYEKGSRFDADAICNMYGRQGIHFLKPLWEEYQKKATPSEMKRKVKISDEVQMMARYYMAPIDAYTGRPAAGGVFKFNATISFVKTPERSFAVINQHILEEFEKLKHSHPDAYMQVHALDFGDLKNRIIDINVEHDLVTLRVDEKEVKDIGKYCNCPKSWPPKLPSESDILITTGFPQQFTKPAGHLTKHESISILELSVSNLTGDRFNIVCNIDVWEKSFGCREIKELANWGGISGSPVFRYCQDDGIMPLEMIGVVSDLLPITPDKKVLIVRPLSLIQLNGKIK